MYKRGSSSTSVLDRYREEQRDQGQERKRNRFIIKKKKLVVRCVFAVREYGTESRMRLRSGSWSITSSLDIKFERIRDNQYLFCCNRLQAESNRIPPLSCDQKRIDMNHGLCTHPSFRCACTLTNYRTVGTFWRDNSAETKQESCAVGALKPCLGGAAASLTAAAATSKSRPYEDAADLC
ncbi:hypothetical protein EVAR_56880_1 [Eumeta japonica]|uniref:Uncharacterized protein n=1 Tax=Eumeta variegata TaxID=151549 RepID=A0A4C1Z9N8_EUMVA|nr:hypothetical protein EVAR_56880_1 [Eumeta japonica]